VGSAVAIVGSILLPETYAPVLIERKVRRLRMETGNQHLKSKFDTGETTRQRIYRALVRPIILLTTQPIVVVWTIFNSIIYGILYIFLTTVSRTFEQTYHERVSIASLNYLATGLGFLVGERL
jgi:hypothetical protein